MESLSIPWKYQHYVKLNSTATSTCIYLILIFIAVMAVKPAFATVHAEEPNTRNASEPSFVEKLRNPCSLVNKSSLRAEYLSQYASTHSVPIAILLKFMARKTKEYARDVLTDKVVPDCTDLNMSLVADLPSEDTLNNGSLEDLKVFYTPLLNTTTFMYSLSDVLNRNSSGGTCSNSDLPTKASLLAIWMKELLCEMRVSTLLGEHHHEPSFDETILEDVDLVDETFCSRLSVTECQIVWSSFVLLTKLSDFLNSIEFIEPAGSTESTAITVLVEAANISQGL